MQKLIADYLFQNKNCALPKIGTLGIKTAAATSILQEQKITAPFSTIYFKTEITDSRNLIEFIAANKNVSVEEAAYQLKNICTEISNLSDNKKFSIEGVGEFYKSTDGNLSFQSIDFPTVFYPYVYAESVIHPVNLPQISVGDDQPYDNTKVEHFSENDLQKKQLWKWAAVLFVAALALIILYANNENNNSFFGVVHKYDVAPATKTYRKLP